MNLILIIVVIMMVKLWNCLEMRWYSTLTLSTLHYFMSNCDIQMIAVRTCYKNRIVFISDYQNCSYITCNHNVHKMYNGLYRLEGTCTSWVTHTISQSLVIYHKSYTRKPICIMFCLKNLV